MSRKLVVTALAASLFSIPTFARDLIECDSTPWEVEIGFKPFSEGLDTATVSIDNASSDGDTFEATIAHGGLKQSMYSGLILTSTTNPNKHLSIKVAGNLANVIYSGHNLNMTCHNL